MAEVVLFHHAQGLTPGVVSFADEIRASGHVVHTPDVYDGRTFDSLARGVAYAKEVGFEELSDRSVRSVDRLPSALVYAGFSLGVGPAQQLAQTRAGASGALLFAACLPVAEYSESWPASVPVQVHAMDHDPEFANEWDLPAARALVEEAEQGELFLYPGDQHLFADSSLSSYEPAAAALMTSRVLDFLATR